MLRRVTTSHDLALARDLFAEYAASIAHLCGASLDAQRFDHELATLPGFLPERRRVTDEHRLVFWEGALVAHAPYYDVESELDARTLEAFAFLGDVIGSPFFTADVARLASGGTTVIEINDGGCSVLPELLDPRDLYRRIARA